MSLSQRVGWAALLCAAALCLSVGCAAPEPGEEPEFAEDQDAVPRDGDEALAWLLEGNRRFVEGRPRHDHESMRRVAMLQGGQHPFGIALGCADSRVPPELVFDHGLGDMFVIRVAGNVVAEDEAGSIEYAVGHLHVPLIIVLGHEGCGAVTAALRMSDGEPEELVTLLERVKSALAGIDPSLPMEEQVRLGVEANVRQSVRQINAIIEREVHKAKGVPPKVVGAVYELGTGRVRVLDP